MQKAGRIIKNDVNLLFFLPFFVWYH